MTPPPGVNRVKMRKGDLILIRWVYKVTKDIIMLETITKNKKKIIRSENLD